MQRGSDNGSTCDSVLDGQPARIGDFAYRLQKKPGGTGAEIAHRFGVLADSQRGQLRQSGRGQPKLEVVDGYDATAAGEAGGNADHEGTLGTGISGALSIAFGAIIIIWPNISLFSLVIVFGAFALARGIIDLGTAISGSVKEGRGWLVLSGLAGIVVGLLCFFWTGMSALALLYVIGAYAVVLGLIALIAAYALVLGVAELTVAIGGKRLLNADLKRALTPPDAQPTR
jgi:uncharacterized membrane protein HdeD (DUF308 family)